MSRELATRMARSFLSFSSPGEDSPPTSPLEGAPEAVEEEEEEEEEEEAVPLEAGTFTFPLALKPPTEGDPVADCSSPKAVCT
jgi:hypothetical protein